MLCIWHILFNAVCKIQSMSPSELVSNDRSLRMQLNQNPKYRTIQKSLGPLPELVPQSLGLPGCLLRWIFLFPANIRSQTAYQVDDYKSWGNDMSSCLVYQADHNYCELDMQFNKSKNIIVAMHLVGITQ